MTKNNQEGRVFRISNDTRKKRVCVEWEKSNPDAHTGYHLFAKCIRYEWVDAE